MDDDDPYHFAKKSSFHRDSRDRRHDRHDRFSRDYNDRDPIMRHYDDKADMASSRGGAALLQNRDTAGAAGSGSRPGSGSGGKKVHPVVRAGQRGSSVSTDDSLLCEDNPHELMAMEMMTAGNGAASNRRVSTVSALDSDLFDESLRYSNVDRPKFKIEKSSPTANVQLRGDFQTEEERIANLFASAS